MPAKGGAKGKGKGANATHAKKHEKLESGSERSEVSYASPPRMEGGIEHPEGGTRK